MMRSTGFIILVRLLVCRSDEEACVSTRAESLLQASGERWVPQSSKDIVEAEDDADAPEVAIKKAGLAGHSAVSPLTKQQVPEVQKTSGVSAFPLPQGSVFPDEPFSFVAQRVVWGKDEPPLAVLQFDGNRKLPEAANHRDIALFAVCTIILLVLSPVLTQYGVVTYMLCAIQLVCICSTQLLVKQCINSGFKQTSALTALHWISTSLVATFIERPCWKYCMPVFPTALMSSFSALASNAAMKDGGAGFVAMITACTSVATCFVTLMLGRSVTMREGLAAAVVSIGGALCIKGEAAASLICICLGCTSMVLRAGKLIYQCDLMALQMSPHQLNFWSCIWGIAATVPLLIQDHNALFADIQQEWERPSIALLFIVLSTTTATTLNTTGPFVLKTLGPVFYSVFSVLSFLILELLAALWLEEPISKMQVIGLALLAAGPAIAKLQCTATPPVDKEAK
eukprot:TRINITY_DN29172_c0_g1_i1.p1 TRINITY_DN29172_c0_g1~~TRINITY_DN29172_c0_g1_i1.p1  ORF type:complete len:455 (+),score=84.65 TRINITY_DN29172_c0_g1_i1:91-1455(+)